MTNRELMVMLIANVTAIDGAFEIEELEEIEELMSSSFDLKTEVMNKVMKNRNLKKNTEDLLKEIFEAFSLDLDTNTKEVMLKTLLFFSMSDGMLEKEEKEILLFLKTEQAEIFNQARAKLESTEEIFQQIKSFIDTL